MGISCSIAALVRRKLPDRACTYGSFLCYNTDELESVYDKPSFTRDDMSLKRLTIDF